MKRRLKVETAKQVKVGSGADGLMPPISPPVLPSTGAHRATSSTSCPARCTGGDGSSAIMQSTRPGPGASAPCQSAVRAPGNPTLQRPWPQAALAGVRQAAHLCSRQTPALHAMVHLTLARCPPASGARAGMGQCARIVVARAVVALGRAFMQLSGRSERPVGHRLAARGRSTSKSEEAINRIGS